MKKILPIMLLLSSFSVQAVSLPDVEGVKTVKIDVEKDGKLINQYNLSQSGNLPIMMANTQSIEYTSQISFNESTGKYDYKKDILNTGVILAIFPQQNKDVAQLSFSDTELMKMEKVNFHDKEIDLPSTKNILTMKEIKFSKGSKQQVELAQGLTLNISIE